VSFPAPPGGEPHVKKLISAPPGGAPYVKKSWAKVRLL